MMQPFTCYFFFKKTANLGRYPLIIVSALIFFNIVDTNNAFAHIDSYNKDTLPRSVHPNVIKPDEDCLIIGSSSVYAGHSYFYNLNCSGVPNADYWEVTCGIILDYSSDYALVQWNASGCTSGMVKAKTFGGATLATKAAIITKKPPPPPPSINYSPLFTSTNFIKTVDLSRPVGATEGTAGVNNGTANFNIPIFTPPGTQGLQPTLAIVYNSFAAAGVVGYGWNISGLSMISRIGKNIHNDGVVTPVSFTNEDGFLIDGVRLYTVSGTNGANGTIYATESETFARITSNTTGSADNPDWFKVLTKDGTVLEYGRTTDSRIFTDNGSNVMFWRLNRTMDISGNYIDYVYENTDRDSRIKFVKYTGNKNTGQIPFNQIDFNYALRTDQNSVYDAGSLLTSKFLLTDIHVTAGSSTVKTYFFKYGFNNMNSFLKEVVEAGSGGTALNSTIFLYGDQPQDIVVSPTTALAGSLDFFAGEYDADGKRIC